MWVFRAHMLDPVKTPEDERLEHNPHGWVWSLDHMICSFQPLIFQECRDWSLFGPTQKGLSWFVGSFTLQGNEQRVSLLHQKFQWLEHEFILVGVGLFSGAKWLLVSVSVFSCKPLLLLSTFFLRLEAPNFRRFYHVELLHENQKKTNHWEDMKQNMDATCLFRWRLNHWKTFVVNVGTWHHTHTIHVCYIYLHLP